MTNNDSSKTFAQNSGVGRRNFMVGTAATGAALAVGLKAPAILAQTKAPLKIGCLLPFSKFYAVLGQTNVNGMSLYFDQIGWEIAGRKIELIKEDDEVNPQVGLQKLKKLVESNQVDFVCGPVGSNVALAILDYVRQSKAFLLVSSAGITSLSQQRIPYMFRTSTSSLQHNMPMGEWVYNNKAKEVVLIASDFAGGRDCMNEFKSRFLAVGGKVIKEIWPPLGTNDYSSYIGEIRAAKPQAVFSFFAGTDAVRFVKQYADFGLKAQIPLMGSGFMVESDTLPAQGDSALGIISTLHYAETLDNPENVAFVKAFHEKHKEYPSCYTEYGYVTARVIHEALKTTDGNTTDKDKLAAAVSAVAFNAPRGPFSFDPETHNVIHNTYIREVVKQDGRLTNRVIATIEKVRDPGEKPA